MVVSEPISGTGAAGATLIGIISALVGHEVGMVATIVFAALVGTLVSLGEVDTGSRMDAAKYVCRYVLMAVVLSGAISVLFERWLGVPAIEMVAIVAFTIGWIGNRWGALRLAIAKAIESFVGRKGS